MVLFYSEGTCDMLHFLWCFSEFENDYHEYSIVLGEQSIAPGSWPFTQGDPTADAGVTGRVSRTGQEGAHTENQYSH